MVNKSKMNKFTRKILIYLFFFVSKFVTVAFSACKKQLTTQLDNTENVHHAVNHAVMKEQKTHHAVDHAVRKRKKDTTQLGTQLIPIL